MGMFSGLFRPQENTPPHNGEVDPNENLKRIEEEIAELQAKEELDEDELDRVRHLQQQKAMLENTNDNSNSIN